MERSSKRAPEQRRFLVINYWIGSRDNGYLYGPVLVSTCDYEQFHLWDEPGAAVLEEDEYEIIELYPHGLSYDQAVRRFAKEFPPAVVGPPYSIEWAALDGVCLPELAGRSWGRPVLAA
ncbi:MAG TPA: hypothetical protein VF897_12115 [Roseiflexaceae bacterium]